MQVYVSRNRAQDERTLDLILVVLASLLLGFETRWWIGVVTGFFAIALLPERK